MGEKKLKSNLSDSLAIIQSFVFSQSSLGGFKLKSEEPAADLKVGSLFANRHKKEDPPAAKPLTGRTDFFSDI